MAARIDAARREIECQGRRVPFRLDLRDDAATLTLDGRDYRVCPLRWREKATLARFASAGPELMREEFLRLCVTPEPPPSEALLELARWMNDAPDGQSVPFDTGSVAGVTLQLCRALHLPPSDFEAMRAVDVEALWQALGGAEAPESEAGFTGAAPASPAATKIVIVPDPPADAASTSAPTPTTPPPPVPVPTSTPAPTSPPTAPPATTAAAATAQTPSGSLRFRVLNTASRSKGAPAHKRSGEPVDVESHELGNSPRSSPTEPSPAAPARQRSVPGAVSRQKMAMEIVLPPNESPAHEVAPRESGEVRHDLAPLVTFGANALEASPVIERFDRAVPAALDRDALFEELAERLERAAADMGIGED